MDAVHRTLGLKGGRTLATRPEIAEVAPISALVPYLQVADVERSVEFYRLLGFEVGNREPKDGKIGWAWLYQPSAPDWKRGANLMVSRTDQPVEAKAQRAMFYLYAEDLKALHAKLESAGIKVGGIEYPFYLPKGEFQMFDPDGYVVNIGQKFEATP
jgi:catechol 2,3-dioxygenase-like lactoylglutathione lyase family enzyme